MAIPTDTANSGYLPRPCKRPWRLLLPATNICARARYWARAAPLPQQRCWNWKCRGQTNGCW